METETAPPAPRRGPLFRISSFIDNSMRTFFFRLGYLVAGNPFKTMAISVLIVALSLIGMLRFRSESRPGELWVPQGTVALQNQAYVEANYGQTVRFSSIAFVAKTGGGLATKAAFNEMLDVARAGFNIQVDGIQDEDGADGTPIFFKERCVQTSDSQGNPLCVTTSAFSLFYDPALAQMGQDGTVDFFETVRAKIDTLTDAEIRAELENPPVISPVDGTPFNAAELIGGTTGQGNNFRVDVLLYNQFAENNAIVENGDLVDKEAEKLEERWTDFLLEETPLLQSTSQIEWKLQSEFSQNDSLSEALTGDLPLLSVGFVLLGVYVTLFLGDFHSVRSHMLLAAAALLTTGLALGACFGISSATGMFFGPVHQILPLLIIGIGIDDCFHITRAADEAFSRPDAVEKSLRLKVALALSQSGSAITVTSFTNVVVFLLSAISRLPALRFFALWAAIGVFAAWALSITFYTACVTLDFRRSQAKRRDCCPCFPPVQEVKELNWFKRPAGGFSRFFANQFGPLILNRYVRIVLLVLFAGLFAACAYGTSQLYLKFRFAFFYPSGSAQREYQDVIDENFELGDTTNIYVRDVDLSTTENQLRLLRLCATGSGDIAQNEWIQGNTVNCWYQRFRDASGIDSENSVSPPGTFAGDVRSFLQSPAGGRFSDSVLFTDDGSQVIGCRFSAQYIFRPTNDDEIDSLLSVRETADSVGFGTAEDGTPKAFPYTFLDTFSEQYAALPQEIGISLGLAATAVAVVCLILIGHPIVALISVLVVGIIIIDVLGFTNFFGINLNSVSVITLVLSTGISVDFVVHIMRSFLEHVGTRKERAIKALETMGPPVFYAGFSTFLAIIVLSIARSYIFQVIFQGFLFLIIMGFLHGLILGPIILSLIGPPSFYDSEDDKIEAEKRLEARVTGIQEKDPEKLAQSGDEDSV